MARDRRDVLVRMPAALKRRLAREVEARGTNLNDVAVGILASRFGVSFEPSGRRGTARGAEGDVLLRMPPALKERLARRASERKRTLTQLIVETLSERLGGDIQRKDSMASTNGSSNGKARSEDKVRVAIIG